MMQRSRTNTSQTRAEQPHGAPPSPQQAAQTVRLIAGADVQDMALAGRTVAEARTVAQAVFGIHAQATALVDGRAVSEAHTLLTGQQLEFTKYAGQKGAAADALAAAKLVVEVSEDRAVWRRNARVLGSTTLSDLVSRIGAVGETPASWRLYPRQVRLMVTRRQGAVTGVVIEMPPGPRRVRWIADDSGMPFGEGARYDERQLSFPWVVLLVVFVNGELSHHAQAFYRATPIASLDDELCYTNLLNVARGHGLASWVCLVNLGRRLGTLGWDERLHVVTEHFWQAAFNRSSEVHEGNSYFTAMRGVDKRVAGAAAWEASTRADPYFALSVRWRKTERSLGATLAHMLDMVAPRPPLERVEQLVTLLQADGSNGG
jgi:hypothetical protein